MSEDINELRARISELEATLYAKRNDVGDFFKLSKVKTHIITLLMMSKSIDKTMVEETLNIVTDLKVAICTLRKELQPWGIEIYSKRGHGYWLDDETKARINAMVADAANSELHSE
jgi:hypothetical protein